MSSLQCFGLDVQELQTGLQHVMDKSLQTSCDMMLTCRSMREQLSICQTTQHGGLGRDCDLQDHKAAPPSIRQTAHCFKCGLLHGVWLGG